MKNATLLLTGLIIGASATYILKGKRAKVNSRKKISEISDKLKELEELLSEDVETNIFHHPV